MTDLLKTAYLVVVEFHVIVDPIKGALHFRRQCLSDGHASMRQIARVLKWSPVQVALWGFLIGMILLFMAHILRLDSVRYQPTNSSVFPSGFRKQVGYFTAFSWSLTSIVIIPVGLYLSLSTYQRWNDLLRDLVERQMLRDRRYQPISLQRAKDAWTNTAKTAVPFVFAIFVLVIGFALYDFFSVAGNYLLARQYPTSQTLPLLTDEGEIDSNNEIDWSVATLIDRRRGAERQAGQLPPPWPTVIFNFTFDLIAYLLIPGLGLSCYISFFVFPALVASFLSRRGQRVSDLTLVSDPNSADDRKGFEIFQGMFERILLITALGAFALYLMHIQNIYLRSPDPDFYTFIAPSISRAVEMFKASEYMEFVNLALGNVVDETGSYNIQSVWAFLLLMFMYISVFFILISVLREAALTGHRRLTTYLGRELSEIVVWPLRWPTLRMLLGIMLLVALTMVFYKIGIVTGTLLLLAAGLKIWKSNAPR